MLKLVIAITATVLVLLAVLSMATAGTLNEAFPFPSAVYTFLPSGGIDGSGLEGDLALLFHYAPDPEGGHPLGRTLRITDGDEPIYQGVLLSDPIAFPEFLRFEVTGDGESDRRDYAGGTWDVPSRHHVPLPGTGLLLGLGGLLVVLRALADRVYSERAVKLRHLNSASIS